MHALKLFWVLIFWSMATVAVAQTAPDVRMVVDVSGSMKQNDPQNLRANALGFAAALLPSSASSSVWTFGTTVDNPLRTGVVDASWRELADRLAPRLTDYQQFTDIERALRSVTADAGNDTATSNRHLILLTDGMVDLPATGEQKTRRDAASRQRILDELAPELADENIVVHTIALSRNVDRSMLEQVAQTTGGLAAVARTPEELLRAFLDVLDRILPGDRVPIDDRQHFAIDDDIDQFSALLFHAPDQTPPVLVGPDGTRYSRDDHPGRVEWLSNDRYDLINMPDPTPGDWRIEGDIGADSRIGIQAGIALRSNDLPATLYQSLAMPLEVWLEDRGQPLAEDTLPAGLSVHAELRSLEGDVLSRTALVDRDGRFRGELPGVEVLGNARLAVVAEGDSLVRERVQPVNVVAALSAELSEDGRRIVVRANHPDLDASNTQLSASLIDRSLNVRQSGEREWTIDVPETNPDESRPVRITAVAELDGRQLQFELPIVQLNPEASVGLSGADAASAIQSDSREQDEALGNEGEFDFNDGLTPSQMLDVAVEKAHQAWRFVQPYVGNYVVPYAKRPITWFIIAALLLIGLLWRWRRAAKHRRRSQRAEPSL